MHATAWPELLEINPGEPASFAVTVTNTSTIIDAYAIEVLGVDPRWVETTPARLSLFPGDVDTVAVTVSLPFDHPSSQRTLALNVRSENDPGEFALAHVELAVAPSTLVDVQIDPPMVQGGRRARFGIVVGNTGNATVHAVPVATDPEDLAKFAFVPALVAVPAGHSQVVQVVASGGRAWFGPARARTFALGVVADEERIERPATFIQRPRIGRWMLSLLGLLAAAAVFAAVLSRTFDQVVDEAAFDDRVLERALADGGDGGGAIPVNPGTVTGTVTSVSSGVGVPGVQAELYDAGDTTVPIATAATDGDGVYTFGSLRGGTYKLRFTGAGFAPIWYPAGANPAQATEVEVVLGETSELDDLSIGGLPGSVTGEVTGEDPTGAVASLVVAGQLDPSTSALVAQTEVSADGSFTFESVPSPAQYELIVEKVGFATERRALTVAPGQALDGIEVVLRPGDGVITGYVADAGGPLGGATVVATDGSNTVDTVSLTVDENRGWFAVRNLATPGRYTVTIARDGYATESRSVALGAAEESRLDVTLTRSLGSIAGTVATGDLGPRGGVSVHITGADFDVTTTTVSQGGTVGSFLVDRVPVPGSYTLTFSKEGYVSQVQLVELDPRTGAADLAGIDVVLVVGTATVRGVVRNSDGAPVSQASISLSDGTNVLEARTADAPLGQFEFTGIAPGSYTVRAELVGTTESVTLISLLPASVRELDLRLGIQASISGSVDQENGEGQLTPAAGRTVRLIPLADFPRTLANALSTTTDAQGGYRFGELEGGVDFVVAVYEGPASPVGEALDSVQVRSADGLAVSAPRDLVIRVLL